MWNLPQHSYEEIREVVIDTLLSEHVDQYAGVLEQVARKLATRHNAPPLPTGMAYRGAHSQLHPNDSSLVLEAVWDLFRQGFITLGRDTSNPGWPWLRLTRFGREINRGPYRFHDTTSFLKLVKADVPDISDLALTYLDEAVATFYADCLRASCVMLGAAAESEFLRLIEAASSPTALHCRTFQPLQKHKFVRQKITHFHDLLKPLLKTLPNEATEDLEINLTAIQSVLRIARNEAGHPSDAATPSREQVYVFLQLFLPFARQLMRLRKALS
jgi:hypothetical protein